MITQLSLEGFSCVVNRLQFAAEVLWLWYDTLLLIHLFTPTAHTLSYYS